MGGGRRGWQGGGPRSCSQSRADRSQPASKSSTRPTFFFPRLCPAIGLLLRKRLKHQAPLWTRHTPLNWPGSQASPSAQTPTVHQPGFTAALPPRDPRMEQPLLSHSFQARHPSSNQTLWSFFSGKDKTKPAASVQERRASRTSDLPLPCVGNAHSRTHSMLLSCFPGT